jgi:hypothetical protein
MGPTHRQSGEINMQIESDISSEPERISFDSAALVAMYHELKKLREESMLREEYISNLHNQLSESDESIWELQKIDNEFREAFYKYACHTVECVLPCTCGLAEFIEIMKL